MTRIATLLRMLLIAGLAVAPLSAHALASSGGATMTMDQTAAAMPADSAAMPCDDAAMDCGDMHCPDMHGDKACPCLAACAAMYVLALPHFAPLAASLSVAGERMAVSSASRLASLAATPPARPPRS